MKLSEIAKLLNGRLIGNDAEIKGVSDLENQKEDTISFAENKKYFDQLSESLVSAIIIDQDLETGTKPVVKVKDAKLAFTKVLELPNAIITRSLLTVFPG